MARLIPIILVVLEVASAGASQSSQGALASDEIPHLKGGEMKLSVGLDTYIEHFAFKDERKT